MSESKSCPKCGSELPANAPEGICPTCLLQAGLPGDSAAAAAPDLQSTSATNSGFVPPKPAELAERFPQLEILELLGKGGMGAVYKARQRELDRLVAVKILPPEVGADPHFSQRFTREARALATLSHQNIVSIFDFGRVDGQYYFVMEFVDGANLRHLMERGGLQPDEALAIVPQICEALQFAHQAGVVHRDIKPENILIDKQGRVKIADFGLVKLLGGATEDSRLTGTLQAMGTLHYMAPEQLRAAASVDNRADIYSLGVVFYEMLTGELPIGRFAPPSTRVQVDVRLDEVVLRALENKPEQRYQQASEVKTDIDSIASAPSLGLGKPRRPEAAGLAADSASWPTPRFSRKAILGAVWAAFFFLAVPPSVLVMKPDLDPTASPGSQESSVYSEGDFRRSPLRHLAITALLVLLPLGATAPFATTILGVIALTEIRHSRSRLLGLPLALADALLFPLLLLNAFICFACISWHKWQSSASYSIAGALAVGVLICLVVDFLIIRWAWQRAQRDLDSAARGGKPK